MVKAKNFAADAQVTAKPTKVYGVILAGEGITAGDKVLLSDSASGAGTTIITLVSEVANGSTIFTPSVGIDFFAGVYADVTKTGGTMSVTVLYD